MCTWMNPWINSMGSCIVDVTKINDEIRYLDLEPKKKFGGRLRLAVSAYIVALVVLLVGAVLQAIG